MSLRRLHTYEFPRYASRQIVIVEMRVRMGPLVARE
jgi:hypothetical protein